MWDFLNCDTFLTLSTQITHLHIRQTLLMVMMKSVLQYNLQLCRGGVCLLPEVCGQHHPHWANLLWGWVDLQVWNWPSDDLVQSEQPGAQRSQDSGDGSRTQPHPPPSPCVTPQLTLWSPFVYWAPPSPRTSSGSWTPAPSPKRAQQRMYFLQQRKEVQSAKDNDGAVHPDQNLMPQEQLLPHGNWPH